MSQKQVILTREGLTKLEEELDVLKGAKRREVAERIKQARAFGDISENSEYEDAKKEQEELECKIAQVEYMLKNAVIINESDVGVDVVTIGSKVVIFDSDLDEQCEYKIVGSAEASPEDHRISNESPIGIALLGKKVGDVVAVTVPGGTVNLKIINIHK